MLNINKSWYLRKDKINKKGKAPIYLQLSEVGAKTEIYIKRKVLPNKWDSDKQRYSGKENAQINYALEQLMAKVAKIGNKFLLEETPPTLNEIKK